MDEETILQNEIDSVRAELEWIMGPESGHVNNVFQEVRRLLKSTVETLSDVSTSALDSKLYSTPLTTEDDSVQGFVGLCGHSIKKASLQFTFKSLNRGVPFKTAIAHDAPYIIYQVQNASNYLLEAHTIACDSNQELLGLMNDPNRELYSHWEQGRQYVCQTMDKLMLNLNHAKDQLVRSERKSLREACNEHTNINVYRPSLPDGLVVDFRVDYGSLIMTTYLLNPLTSTPTNDKINQAQHRGKWFDIEDIVELESSIPALGESLTRINSCYEMCQRFKDNLNSLMVKGLR
eukprot:CFRG5947T1